MKKILSLCLAPVLLLLVLAGCSASKAATSRENTIPFPESYDTESSGASSYNGIGDHENSAYFAHPDFYNMSSGGSLKILPKFKTYQQTTEWSCGTVAALMVLHHYGVEDWNELDIAEIAQSNTDLNGTNTANPGLADEEGEYGTSTSGIVKFFESIDWDVQSSLDHPEGTFEDPADFQAWIVKNLDNGIPIMIEWIDWGGHWQTVIGYDDMGTEDHFGDDVLILADPYDTSDHLQDGYFIVPAERFFYMWYDSHILPLDQKYQQWVIATPRA